MGTLYAYRDRQPVLGAGTVLFDSAEVIGDSHGPVRIGSRVQVLENTVLHLLPDNELLVEDDVIIGPGAMIHGCHLGRGTVVEPAAVVCDSSSVGPQSIVRAGASVKQRDVHAGRSVLDGFPARQPAPRPPMTGGRKGPGLPTLAAHNQGFG